MLIFGEGYALTYVIAPCTTYGYPKNGLVDAGLQNIHSVQLPILIRQGLKRGQGGIIGKGQNKWPNVHIDDCELHKKPPCKLRH